MFRPNKSRRESNSTSSKQHGTRSRRLRVELMEGRLMLAASSLDVLQTSPNPTQPIATIGQFSDVVHLTFQSQPTDGGYVDVNVFKSWTQSLYGVAGQYTSDYLGAADTTGYHLGIPQVSPVDDAGLQIAVIVSDFENGNSGSALSPFEMKPIVIGPTPSQPSPTSPAPSAPGPSEGGSIPIHAIFADFRQDGHLASGVKSVSSLLTEASIDSIASTRGPSKSDDAVAGEWARATVFEIAGGEPSELTSLDEKSTKTSDNSDVIPQSDPLSTIQSPHESTGYRATKFSQAGAADGQVGQQVAQAEDMIAVDDATANLPDPAYQADPSEQVSAPSNLQDSIQLASATNPETAAVEAVFRRLGEDKAAVVESNLHGKSWLHSIGTSPLLIALALERIAALNSRRARREAKVSPSRLPRQSPK